MNTRSPWMRPALIACALMTTNCAASRPASVAPPRLSVPAEAIRSCDLARLPEAPTLTDLEVAYLTRGAQLIACDAARRLAVDSWMAERAMQEGAKGGARQQMPGR